MKIIVNNTKISKEMLSFLYTNFSLDSFYVLEDKIKIQLSKIGNFSIKKITKEELKDDETILVLNEKNFDFQGIKLLLKNGTEKSSISTLIYYKEKIKNQRIVEIDDNYLSISYNFKKKKNEGYVPSEMYIIKSLLLYQLFDSLKKKDMFEYIQKERALFCIPYAMHKGGTTKRKKIAFLDRDGILINDNGFPHKKEHLHINKEVIPLLTKLKDRGYEFIIVTNQSGIARGKFSISDYKKFHALMLSEFKKHNITFLDTFFCPYFEDGSIKKYSKKSLLRKPYPGMILQALSKYNIDIEKSFMIGDRISDIIKLPYLKSFIVKGIYPIDKNIKAYNNFNELYSAIIKEKDNEKS